MSLAPSRDSIAQLHQELIAQHRQALLGSVAGMLAHEFNNLMTPVMFRTQDALSRNDPEAMRKAVECTARQTERAIAIGRRLLELIDDDSAEVASYRVDEAVENATIAIVRPLSKDGIDFTREVEPDLAIRAERVLFDQLLINLLLNARAATIKRRGAIRLSATRDGDRVRIDVVDNGTGIDPTQLNDVIRPFLAADPATEPCDWRNIGLGLNVCRLIAHRHDARIDAESNPGGGCTFRLIWPVG
jgi:signal transduction histidine kinase